MKKFIIICCCLILLAAIGTYVYLGYGIRIFPSQDGSSDLSAPFVQQEKNIYKTSPDGAKEPFEIKGVDLGAGQPGNFATDYAITKDTYLRWFKQIQDMGANTIRVYIVLGTDFYEAFYEYNQDNPNPLYLIHGVWLNDYANNSHMSGFDAEYLSVFKEDVRTMIDVIHGARPIELGRLAGTGSYTKDISKWVVGYILGVEWEPPTVCYTNLIDDDKTSFKGEYLYTEEGTDPFLNMLAEVGDEAFRYETERYNSQHLVAFSNWPQTDPNEFPELIEVYFSKFTALDVDLVYATDKVASGMFASYHIYPYHPDFLRYIPEYANLVDTGGNVNTYYTYLKLLNEHHRLPVVISEFGVPSARGRASVDVNTYRSQGGLSEEEQAYAVIQCYKDIKDAGCAGCVVFSWQDEWFKRAWNTWENVDLLKAPYWSDYQTNEQNYGLLTFDPGNERSVCYVDGDDEEWTDGDIIGTFEGETLSMKYDEKFVYFMVRGDNIGKDQALYIPIDTNQTVGSTQALGANITHDPTADLLASINDEAIRSEVRRILEREADITPQRLADAVYTALRVANQELTISEDEEAEPVYQLASRLISHIEEVPGASSAFEPALEFARAADFLLVIEGENKSRLLVQERYEAIRATSLSLLSGEDPFIDPPERDTALFNPVYMQLNTLGIRIADNDVVESVIDLDMNNLERENQKYMDVYETGKLTYGNANPASGSFNSLADFMFGNGFVEIKIPWQLLNFSNPSDMQIHDDYYENYGVDNIAIGSLWVGMGDGSQIIPMFEADLEGWGADVTYHERLKQSYYVMQDLWTGKRSAEAILAESSLGKTDKGKPENEPYVDSSVVQSLAQNLYKGKENLS